jgi:hypothetical protein
MQFGPPEEGTFNRVADVKLTNLKWGPFPLNRENVDSLLWFVSPGTYALGTVSKKGVLEIEYVGRADDDLNKRLKEHIGRYTHFAVTKHPSPREAHQHECRLYHDFGPPDNQGHPRPPAGDETECAQCAEAA